MDFEAGHRTDAFPKTQANHNTARPYPIRSRFSRGPRARLSLCDTEIMAGAADPKSVKVNVTTGAGMDIEWTDGHSSHYSFPFLRDACPCALCDDERSKTGRQPGDTHVQTGSQAGFDGGRGQVRDQIQMERWARTGNLFVAVSAGCLPVRGMQGAASSEGGLIPRLTYSAMRGLS